jgi:hypothetical protein
LISGWGTAGSTSFIAGQHHWLPKLTEEGAKSFGGALVTFDLAGPAVSLGVVGEAGFEAETFTQSDNTVSDEAEADRPDAGRGRSSDGADAASRLDDRYLDGIDEGDARAG